MKINLFASCVVIKIEMDQEPFVPSPKLRKLQRANRKREALGAGGLVQLHALQRT